MQTLADADDQTEIVNRLRSVAPDDTAKWGGMSAAEMLCQVRGAFRVATGELPNVVVDVPMPRELLKAKALWDSTPWKKNFFTVPLLRVGMPTMPTICVRSCRVSAVCCQSAHGGTGHSPSCSSGLEGCMVFSSRVPNSWPLSQLRVDSGFSFSRPLERRHHSDLRQTSTSRWPGKSNLCRTYPPCTGGRTPGRPSILHVRKMEIRRFYPAALNAQ